jgi:hypothetical protein
MLEISTIENATNREPALSTIEKRIASLRSQSLCQSGNVDRIRTLLWRHVAAADRQVMRLKMNNGNYKILKR